MSSIGVVSFGDGSLAYRRAARRVANQALGFPQVSSSLALHKSDLVKLFPSESQHISWDARGLGFWAWKPLSVMAAIKRFEGSNVTTILYVDSGCWVNVTPSSIERLSIWQQTAEQHGAITFSSGKGNTERRFTKQEVFDSLGDGFDRDETQRAATMFMFTVEFAQDFLSSWWRSCKDLRLVDDTYDNARQDPAFITPRHDQSLFSLQAKNYGLPLMKDDIDIHPAVRPITSEQLAVPIWGARHRSGMMSLSMNPAQRAIRMIEQLLP